MRLHPTVIDTRILVAGGGGGAGAVSCGDGAGGDAGGWWGGNATDCTTVSIGSLGGGGAFPYKGGYGGITLVGDSFSSGGTKLQGASSNSQFGGGGGGGFFGGGGGVFKGGGGGSSVSAGSSTTFYSGVPTADGHGYVKITAVCGCSPTLAPTPIANNAPSTTFSFPPVAVSTHVPTLVPTFVPTFVPTEVPSVVPSTSPTAPPSAVPTVSPTEAPTEPLCVPKTTTYSFTGSLQSFTDNCATTLKVDMAGARGGKASGLALPGKGARLTAATFNYVPGSTIYLQVGGAARDVDGGNTFNGGYNGGGRSGFFAGTGGGGSSDSK